MSRPNIVPILADHTAPAFEEVVVSWMRAQHPGASGARGWWGPALNRLRATKRRSTEEIDAVVLRGKQVAAVAEVKWTDKPLDVGVLSDLIDFKITALAQAKFVTSGVHIVLVSKSAFTSGARSPADQTPALAQRGATSGLTRATIGPCRASPGSPRPSMCSSTSWSVSV